MTQHVLCCTCLHMLQGIIFISFNCSSGRCGIFSSSSSQTPSAELTVHAAFFSASFFRHVVSTCCNVSFSLALSILQADVAAYLEVQQLWETSGDAAEKDWRLFDIWDWRFDKLPVISAKLSLRVMGANASGKAICLSDF
ncbi:hypothetical protein ACFX13_017567 [Malus domestica]